MRRVLRAFGGEQSLSSTPDACSLQTQEGFVSFPDEPGEGGEPEPDDGRVGGEDPAIVLRGIAGGYHGYALVVWEAGVLQPLLGGVVEDHGSHGLELASPRSLPGGLEALRQALRCLYEQGVACLLQAEVEVARAVARGDGYLGLPGPDPLQVVTEVGRATDFDVVPELRARRQLAALQLLDAQAGRLALEPVGEVGRGRRGAEGEHHDDEQTHK